MNTMKLRKMDVDNEPIANCEFCGITSTSTDCEVMFKAEVSGAVTSKETPICGECLGGLNDETHRISREIKRDMDVRVKQNNRCVHGKLKEQCKECCPFS